MKISVVGPGAMGCLFAARLALAGFKTVLVDYNAERARRLAKSGLTIDGDPETHTGSPRVTVEIPPRQDLVILLVKAYSTRAVRLPPGVPVLTLQNGLGNAETLCEMAGNSHVLAGTTSEACTYISEGHVRHVAPGTTTIGSWTSCPAEPVVEALGKAGFRVRLTSSPGSAIWEKAAASAGINPLTALLDVTNGRLVEIPEARQLLRDLVVEAAKVAATEGYRFDFSLVEQAEEICRATAANVSSMLQDRRAGRKTEIEAISGEIIRRAELASLPVPRTRVVWQLLKSIEDR